MSKTPVIPTRSGVLIALHQAGRVWRGVAAKRSNGSLTLLDSREFRAGESTLLATWVDQQQPERVICLLPSSSVICRTTTLPDAPEDQLNAALGLQAETYIGGAAPAHRRAMAVLHAAPGEKSRSGILLAWPNRARGPEAPIDREVTYAPVVASIAAMLDGDRFNEPIMWVDRNDGSVALAICHAQGAVFRAAAETSDITDEWRQGIARLVAETAFSVGHSDAFTESLVDESQSRLGEVSPGGALLFLPSGLIGALTDRLQKSTPDAEWWSKYGVAAGALLATMDQLAPLTALRSSMPVETPTRGERVLSRLSTRRAAAVLATIAILLIAIGPLAFAGARLFVLHAKVGDLEEFNDAQAQRESSLIMYEELSRNTWPMAKLLADVSNSAPEGVTLTLIGFDEDANEVDIRGEAPASDDVLLMASNLTQSHIFEDANIDYNDRDQNSSTFKFSISARVPHPYYRATYPDDYAETPLAVRLYGERARPEGSRPPRARTDRTEGGGNGADTSSSPSRTRTADASDVEARSNEFGRTGPRSSRPINIPSGATGEGGPTKPDLPEPLSEEEVSKLTKGELIALMGKIGAARRNTPGLTEEQRKQLKDQFDLMQRYLQTAKEE